MILMTPEIPETLVTQVILEILMILMILMTRGNRMSRTSRTYPKNPIPPGESSSARKASLWMPSFREPSRFRCPGELPPAIFSG